jgi:hypothetical protein
MRLKSLLVCCLWLVAANAFGQAADRVVVRFGTAQADAASAVVERYQSLPKGVVLEGIAEGFEELKAVTYDKEKNEFIINEKMRYKNPVTRKEFVQVFKALRKDDRMGMTLMDGEPRVYGPLSAESDIVKQMIETDKLLGGIAYGFDWLLEGVKLPGDFKPKRTKDRKIPVVAFSRFTNYLFEKAGESYKLSSCNLDVQLIPLAEKKTASGGHLPDEEKAKEYVIEPEDQENLDHLKTHQADYLKIPAFAKTAAAGEAAAFARLVRDSKVDAEEFQKQLNK